jgi:hypothetical protein
VDNLRGVKNLCRRMPDDIRMLMSMVSSKTRVVVNVVMSVDEILMVFIKRRIVVDVKRVRRGAECRHRADLQSSASRQCCSCTLRWRSRL